MESNLENIVRIFNEMQKNGWDTTSPKKWGFFFMNSSPEPLKKLFKELEEYEYKCESLHQASDGTWVLQASKTETLTTEKLHRRNLSFNDLAVHCGVELYDGWDVGNPGEN